MTVWFISGASRGFGPAIARKALFRGDEVVATARDPRRAAKIIVDLASTDSLPQRIQLGATAIQGVTGKVDLVTREQQQWRDIGLSADFDTAGSR